MLRPDSPRRSALFQRTNPVPVPVPIPQIFQSTESSIVDETNYDEQPDDDGDDMENNYASQTRHRFFEHQSPSQRYRNRNSDNNNEIHRNLHRNRIRSRSRSRSRRQRQRQRQRKNRLQWTVWIWLLFGMSMYGVVWMAMVEDDRQSYKSMIRLWQLQLQLQTQPQSQSQPQQQRQQQRQNMSVSSKEAAHPSFPSGDYDGYAFLSTLRLLLHPYHWWKVGNESSNQSIILNLAEPATTKSLKQYPPLQSINDITSSETPDLVTTTTTIKNTKKTTVDSNIMFKQRQKHVNTEGKYKIFDMWFWALVLCFGLMTYARIQSEPSFRHCRHQQRRQHQRRHGRRQRRQQRNSEAASAMSWTQTFRRINEDREALGETSISSETYQTLRMVLLHDRRLLESLAGHSVPPLNQAAAAATAAATQDQRDKCRKLTIRTVTGLDAIATIAEDDNTVLGCECSICLGEYQNADQVSILPCNHSYHTFCIDHWFEQSRLCPLCKQSLEDDIKASD